MTKPRLLDLFSGAGGSAKGYQEAGFRVVGVDHVPQPNYTGDEFIESDVELELRRLLAWRDRADVRIDFDAIHASPPCQALAKQLSEASYFQWEGNPDAKDGWTCIGEDEDGKRALVAYNSFHGASSQPLSDGIPGEWLMPLEKAKELHDRIQAMDRTYWPGFNPTVARIENGEVVEYIQPPDEPEPWPGERSEG